ncbi:DUF3836 domain-containing protein [Phocaeicola sp.]
MKTTRFFQTMMVVVFAMASVFTMNAAEPTKVTNVEMDNGRVSAKIVYLQEGQYLTPDFRFEFTYNDKDQVTEKKALKWNGLKWVNYYCITVTYTATEAHLQYALWDKKSREFRPTEKYVYQIDEAGKFLAQYSYRMDEDNSWQLDHMVMPARVFANR